MAHFAKLDANNVVTFVSTCNNSLLMVDGREVRDNEAAINHLNATVLSSVAPGVKWIQTSYNHNFRKMYASIGFIYSESADVFYPPQPFPSWTLDSNFDWQPPISMPSDYGMDNKYNWDEELYQSDNTKGWVL